MVEMGQTTLATEKQALEQEKILLETEVQEVSEKISQIKSDPGQYAQIKIDRIKQTISGRPGGPGPIKPRKAKPGHVSMYDHLQQIKRDYEDCVKSGTLIGRVLVDTERLEQNKQKSQIRLADCESKLAAIDANANEETRQWRGLKSLT
jgi:hypothetical protein